MQNKLIFWVDRKIVGRFLNHKGAIYWGIPFFFAIAYSFSRRVMEGVPDGLRSVMFLLGTWCAISLARALRVPKNIQEESNEQKIFSQRYFVDPLAQAAALVGFSVLFLIYIIAYILIWYFFMR